VRTLLRFLPVFAAVLVAASCGSDTPTSPNLKQGAAVSAKSKAAKDSTAADSAGLTASVAAPMSARAAKRAAAVSTVCARQRRNLLALRMQLSRTPGSRPLKSKERSVSAAVGDACS
jgi:hypothetical protein